MFISKKGSIYSLILLLVFLIFISLKFLNSQARVSDENYYFYTANLINEGLYPYKDFFFQHLPTQIIIYAEIMRLFGFRLVNFRILESAFVLGTGLLIYLRCRDLKEKDCGLIAVILFLFSTLVLHASDMALGIQEAIFFLILAWYFLNKRPMLAGFFLFIAMTVRIYILPAAIGFGLYELWKRNVKKVFLFFAYSMGPFVMLNLLLFLKFGEKFLTPVWRYHLMKSSIKIEQQVFADFSKSDLLLVMFAIAGVMIIIKKLMKSKQPKLMMIARNPHLDFGLIAVAGLIFQFLFLMSLSLKFAMYLFCLIPFLAILASLALSKFIPERSRRAARLFVLVYAVTNIFIYQRYFAGMSVIENLDQLVREVASITSDQDSLFGQYTVVSLVGLLSERRITDNQVDTNYMRYRTNLLSAEDATNLATSSAVFIQTGWIDEITSRIHQTRPGYINRQVIDKYCRLYSTYRILKDTQENRILVWRCAKSNNNRQSTPALN